MVFDVSDEYRNWDQRRSKIPEGLYLLRCFHAKKMHFEFRAGQMGMSMIVLLFDTDYDGRMRVIPHYCRIPKENHIGQRSYFYRTWTLAAGHPPDRPRLKDMPLYVLEGKYFEGIVGFHKPLESEEISRQLYMFSDLNEAVCVCGKRESEHHGNNNIECKEFSVKRKEVPEELWYSEVKILVKGIPIPT